MAIVRSALAALALCLGSAKAAQADEFSWELSAFGGESVAEELFESDRSALAATYYLDSVDDTSGPVALASFFDPETRVSLAFRRQEQTAQVYSSTGASSFMLPGFKSEAEEYSLGGRHVLPTSRWYFGGHYAKGEGEDPPIAARFSDEKTYGAFAGRYFGPNTTLELELTSAERHVEQPYFVAFGGITGGIITLPVLPIAIFNAGQLMIDSTTDTVRLEALHVRRFRSATYTLSGGVAEANLDIVVRTPAFALPLPPPFGTSVNVPARTTATELGPLRTYSFAGELFPTERVGLRLGYSRFDGDASNDDAFELGATWFVRRDLGLQFLFSRQESEVAAFSATDSAALRVIGRL